MTTTVKERLRERWLQETKKIYALLLKEEGVTEDRLRDPRFKKIIQGVAGALARGEKTLEEAKEEILLRYKDFNWNGGGEPPSKTAEIRRLERRIERLERQLKELAQAQAAVWAEISK